MLLLSKPTLQNPLRSLECGLLNHLESISKFEESNQHVYSVVGAGAVRKVIITGLSLLQIRYHEPK